MSVFTGPTYVTGYKDSLDALKEPIGLLMPPLDLRLGEEGIDYYLKWVKTLRGALYPLDDVFGLTEQIQAMQVVIDFLGSLDGNAYADRRWPEDHTGSIRWAMYMATQQLMTIVSNKL